MMDHEIFIRTFNEPKRGSWAVCRTEMAETSERLSSLTVRIETWAIPFLFGLGAWAVFAAIVVGSMQIVRTLGFLLR